MMTPSVSAYLTSLLTVCCLTAAACDSLLGKQPNPNYCGSDPCPPPDTGGCSANIDCGGSSPVCDVMGSRQCVQCTATDHGACAANAPVCGTDNACRACDAHSECTSNACLADGSCAAETDVAYVDEAGTPNSACLSSMPCISAMAALATGRPYVKIHGTIKEMVTVGNARVATILADPGATLTHDGMGAGLTVSGNGTSLTIYDLTISSAGGSGIMVPRGMGEPALSLIHTRISDNFEGAASVEAGTFTLVRSTVAKNPAGGLFVDGTTKFVIVGNVFFANGGVTSVTGAIRLTASQFKDNRLDFNSFLSNQSQDNGTIQCKAGAFTARNNIIYNPSSTVDPISGTCTHDYALIQPATAAPGTPHLAADPLFMDSVRGDLHLRQGSPAFQAADPSSDLTGVAAQDIDNHPRRPPPASLGAYQMQ